MTRLWYPRCALSSSTPAPYLQAINSLYSFKPNTRELANGPVVIVNNFPEALSTTTCQSKGVDSLTEALSPKV